MPTLTLMTAPPNDDGAVRLIDRPAGRTLLLDRPERRNALTLTMWHDLAALASEYGQDAATPLTVVGAGGYFCSGADLATLAWARSTPARATEFVRAVVTALLTLHTVPATVVALVEGGAAGGGVEIMAACDRRVAVGSPTLVFPFGHHGMVLDDFTRSRLAQLVGHQQAERLADGRHVVAVDEALDLGLLDEVTSELGRPSERITAPAPAGPGYLGPGEDLAAAVARAARPMLAAFP